MKFTFNWLKEFATFDASPRQLADRLTMAGLEVEAIAPLREPESGREDWLIEVNVTPNRGDCLSVFGLAREVAALTGGRLKAQKPLRVRALRELGGVSVSVQDPEGCPRYSGKVIEGVRVGVAPPWMRFRLEACGIRAINNVVDVTNYVMLETGQPLHAFDLDRLDERRIVVRRAGAAGEFVTLDGIERRLAPDDLLICDGDRPVALAGIMGGLSSEVVGGTRRVFLESANFDPVTIRRTAKRLGLHSEASHRFERGVDPEGTVRAAERAAELIAELAGGSPLPGALDHYPRPARNRVVRLREERAAGLLGVRVPARTITKILGSLGLRTARKGGSSLSVTVPTWRPDLTREADLIEEIARLYGYDRIPTTLPALHPAQNGAGDGRGWERRIRALLSGAGLTEVINLPFTSERMNEIFPGLWPEGTAPVTVLNPLVKEQPQMRFSLIPGLIENLRLNLAHKARSFSAFHIGKVFGLGPEGRSEERQRIAGLLYGPRERAGLRIGEEVPLGFLDCKGLVEEVLDLLRLRERVSWAPCRVASLHPGRTAELALEEVRLGIVGQSHPEICDELDVPPFLAFELDFEGLVQYAPRQIKARSLPRFPAVERDFALLLDQSFPSERIARWIKDLGEPLIEHVEVFDEYRGPNIPQGKKSLAYKVSYRAADRTLTDAEVNELHRELVHRIGEVFDAQQR
ncbi:MAG TPA: phenylalanine--tRNA ligase subunit beta [candidate division Zixibacteria bacterium]|nr:phenylalanine--tRNA ligase subunit beta [candidate division Zixibacteria bacterium]